MQAKLDPASPGERWAACCPCRKPLWAQQLLISCSGAALHSCWSAVLSPLVLLYWPSNLAASAFPPSVDRHDPTHWRSVLVSMSLTQEQEAELILLLQSHLKQARGFGWGRAGRVGRKAQ